MSRREPDKQRVPAMAHVAVGLGGVLTSWVDPEVFAGYLAASGAVAVVMACRALPTLKRLIRPLIVVLAAAYPLAVLQMGETGLMWATAAAMLLLGALLVIERLRPGVVQALALGMLLVLGTGFLTSYLVLIRSVMGHGAVVVLAALFFAYELMAALVRQLALRRGKSDVGGLAWLSAGGGLAACAVVALAALFFHLLPYTPRSALLLGVTVGAGAALGRAVALIAHDDRALAWELIDINSLSRLTSLLFAIPFFFYGYRILLT